MAPDKSNRPEREQTDESLRAEREKTDEALLGAKKRSEHEADRVVLRARENADAVLSTAREKADETLSKSPSDSISNAKITESRVLEDDVLRNERDTADITIDRERQDVNQALRRLLPLEREATDRTLITERARSDTALENRDDFLKMVCHDLRDLLSGIVLQTELLIQTQETDIEQTASVVQIQKYAARMNRLISDLVDVASIDSGKLSMLPLRQDATVLISEVVHTFRPIASTKNITLVVSGEHNAHLAHFDHDRRLQVLANLIANSIKFTERGGTITLSCAKKGAELLFRVSDTGSGIPQEMLESIFVRFWQVGKNDRRGLGLGLYISKCIVEAHGGRIWVESTLGEGSTFYFTLPTTE
jgi:signal transduction histidine kinase